MWWVTASLGGRRVRRSLGTADRGEAERRAFNLPAAPGRSSPPLQAALLAWSAYAGARRAPASNRKGLGNLRRAFSALGIARVEGLTTAAVTDYLTAKAAEGCQPRTLNHIRDEFHTFCAWLVDREELGENPIRRVRRFKLPAPAIRHLGHEDIEAMREALAGDPAEAPALTMLWAGLRRSEAVWLDWADVDLERGLLAVRAKPGWQPKNSRNRTVPISGKLRAHLLALRRRQPWCFPAPRGGRWFPDRLSERFRQRMREAGLPWVLLDLRRTFGSHVIRRPGMSYARLAAIMGNSPAICARHYAHLAPEEIAPEDIGF